MDKTKVPLIILLVALIGVGVFAFMLYGDKQNLIQQKEELQKEIEDLNSRYNALNSRYKSATERADRLEEDNRSLETQLADLEREKSDLERRYERVRQDKERLVEQLQAKARPTPTVKVETVAKEPMPAAPMSEEYWADFVREKAQLETKLEDLQKELRETQNKIPDLEKEKKELGIKVDELKKDKAELERKMAFKERSLKILSKDLVSEREMRRKAEEELATLREDNIYLKRDIIMANREKAALEKKVKEISQKKDLLERRISEVESVLREKSLEMADLQDQIYSAVKGGKKVVRSESAAVELPPIVVKPQARPSIAARGVEGEIIAVNQKERFVIVDIGENAGVRPGLRFIIVRGGQKIGTIEIIETRREISAADIREVRAGVSVREGDRVILQ